MCLTHAESLMIQMLESDVRVMRETYCIILQDYLYGPTMIPISWSCLYALYYLKNLPTLKLE